MPARPVVFLAPTAALARAAAFEHLGQASFDPLEPPLIFTGARGGAKWRALFRERSAFMPRLVGAEEFFARSHASNARQRPLGGTDRLWVLSQVARRVAPLLPHLERAVASREWLASIAAFIAEMRRLDTREVPLSDWQCDLQTILDAYDERLHQLRAFDFEAAPALFRDSATRNAAFGWPRTFLVDDLLDPSPALQMGLSALSERAETAVAALVVPGGNEANPALQGALAFWKAQRARFVRVKAHPTPALRGAARFLGEENASPAPPNVRLTRAHTMWDELSRVAAHIRRELDAGARPERFTLVLPSPAQCDGPLQAAFAAHGVPLHVPFERPLGVSPLVRRLLRAFEACRDEWNVHELHDLFGDGTLRLEGFDAARLRRAALAARYPGLADTERTRHALEKKLAELKTPRRDDPARRAAIEAALDADDLGAVARFKAVCGACAGNEKERIGGYAWLSRMDELTTLLAGHWNEDETEAGGVARAQLDALRAAAQAVVERAGQWSEFEGHGEDDEPKRRAGEWLDWLRLECESVTRVERLAGAGVRVAGAHSSLDWSGVVFFAGLSEGAFPAPDVSGPLAVRARELFAAKRLYAASPLARATHQLARAMGESDELWLSFPAFVASRESAPSPLVEDVRALWDNHFWPELAPLDTARPTSRGQYLARLSQWAEATQSLLSPHLQTLATMRQERGETTAIGIYDGVLGARGRDLMAHRATQVVPKPLTASTLELYARCPIRYFFARVLELESEDAGEDDLSALEAGNLVHDILFQFHLAHKAPFAPDDFDSSLRVLSPLARQQCEELALRPILREAEFHRLMGLNGQGGPLWKLLQAEVLAATGGESAPWSAPTQPLANVGWKPEAVKRGLEESFLLQLGDETVKGVIDRLDVSRDGSLAVVIDYKTGDPAGLPSLSSGDNGLNFQLALYALKAREFFAELPTPPRLAMGYLALRSGKWTNAVGQTGTLVPRGKRYFTQSRAVELDDELWEQWLGGVTGRVLFITELVRGGTFNLSLRDAKEAKCGHCDYRTFCAQNEQTQSARSETHRDSVHVYLPSTWRPA